MRWQVSWDELTFATRSKEKGVNLLDGQRSEPYHIFFLQLGSVRLVGFEPTTNRLEVCCSFP